MIVTLGLPIKEERFGKPPEVMRDVRSAIQGMVEFTRRHFGDDFKIYEAIAESGDPVQSRMRLFDQMRGQYLFMLDADSMPERDVLVKLIEADKDIIACPMVQQTYPNFLNVFKKAMGENYQPMRLGKDFPLDVPIYGKIIECDAHGFGAVLLKREVFDEIEPPYFERLPHPYFPTIMYGHDVSFSIRAKLAGLKIYSHFGAMVKHACVGWLDYNHHFDALTSDSDIQEIFDIWDSNEEVIISG